MNNIDRVYGHEKTKAKQQRKKNYAKKKFGRVLSACSNWFDDFPEIGQT